MMLGTPRTYGAPPEQEHHVKIYTRVGDDPERESVRPDHQQRQLIFAVLYQALLDFCARPTSGDGGLASIRGKWQRDAELWVAGSPWFRVYCEAVDLEPAVVRRTFRAIRAGIEDGTVKPEDVFMTAKFEAVRARNRARKLAGEVGNVD